MDIILWILVAIVLYKMLKPSISRSPENNEIDEDQHLTTTQRKWRQMKREQELERLVADGNDYTSKYEQIIKLQVEMQQYILDNKRPFHPVIWLFDTIDPRLIDKYIRHLAIMFGIFLLIVSFGVWSTMLTLVLMVNVVMVDFLLYRRQLMLEVTEWNPEFQEKYVKKFENITKGMDIP